MLQAAGKLCPKGKIVFTGASGAEGPKVEGSGVGTSQSIQEKAYIRIWLNKVRLVRLFSAVQKLIRTSPGSFCSFYSSA